MVQIEETKAKETNRRNKGKRNWNLQCEHCKLKGHEKKNYYKIIGYPPNFKSKRKNN